MALAKSSRVHEAVIEMDLGTSECKVCLVTAAGEVIRAAREGYPTHSPRRAWAEQDPADWLQAVARATRRLLAETDVSTHRIVGLALTSAAHIGVLVDADGVPVRRALLWNDQRSSSEVADLERDHGDEILRRTYQAVSTSWTLPHILWVRRHEPQNWARTRRVLLSKDYLAAWLTREAATDPATALSSQLYDATTGSWCPMLCGMVGLKTEALPPVRPATTRVGHGLTAEAAEVLWLTAGTPVIVGTLDSATELLAAGVLATGQGLVRLATAGGVECVIPEPRPSRKLITYPHPVRPLWYCQAGTNSCASAVRWETRILGGEGEVPFATWDAWSAAGPGATCGCRSWQTCWTGRCWWRKRPTRRAARHSWVWSDWAWQMISPCWPRPGQGGDGGSFRRPRTRRGMRNCFPSMSERKRNSARSITKGGRRPRDGGSCWPALPVGAGIGPSV